MSLSLAGQGCQETFPLINNELWICEKHRGNMGENWRPRRTCQYPLHNGQKKELNTRNAVHLDMSREINTIFVELVPTGSREYDF